MLTEAVNCLPAVGANCMVNEVLSPLATVPDGWAVTVKLPASAPEITTFGVPERVSAAGPSLRIVNVRVEVLPLAVLANWVPSVVAGLVSPSAISVPEKSTSMSTGRKTRTSSKANPLYDCKASEPKATRNRMLPCPPRPRRVSLAITQPALLRSSRARRGVSLTACEAPVKERRVVDRLRSSRQGEACR